MEKNTVITEPSENVISNKKVAHQIDSQLKAMKKLRDRKVVFERLSEIAIKMREIRKKASNVPPSQNK
jgi:hypothetical protein